MTKNYYADSYREEILGAKIVDIRAMTDQELAANYWYDTQGLAVVIELDNGKIIVPSQDPEGNGPGMLFIDSLLEGE